jgi:hypothetical protein
MVVGLRLGIRRGCDIQEAVNDGEEGDGGCGLIVEGCRRWITL